MDEGHHESCGVLYGCDCKKSYRETMAYFWDIREKISALNP